MTRQRPWRPEHPDAVVVARPSKWGNIWRLGDPSPWGDHAQLDRAGVVSVYRYHAENNHELALMARSELAGRDLACWCPLDQPCHADVLLGIANGGAS